MNELGMPTNEEVGRWANTEWRQQSIISKTGASDAPVTADEIA